MPLREIYSAASVLDAQLLCDQLLEAGFEAVVNGGYLTGAVGELPPDSLIRVMVSYEPDRGHSEEQFLASAKQIVSRFEQAQKQPEKPCFCSKCGEKSSSRFSHCWACEAPLPSN